MTNILTEIGEPFKVYFGAATNYAVCAYNFLFNSGGLKPTLDLLLLGINILVGIAVLVYTFYGIKNRKKKNENMNDE